MAKSQSTNYTRQKAHYGGIVGTIQQNALEGIILDKDPLNPIFKENLPAGFLACDGKVYNVKDYYCLAQTLGIGDECRFKKDHVTLRNPDAATGDLGQFQVPDLGSKVMVGGRGTGAYDGLTKSNKPNINRVGVEVEASSNVGTRVNCNYNGYMQIDSAVDIDFNGNVRYNMVKETSKHIMAQDEFQAHAHNTNVNHHVLNYTGKARIDGDGKSTGGEGTAASPFINVNAFAGNQRGEVLENTPRTQEGHEHGISKPDSYADNFTYKYSTTQVNLDEMQSYIDVDISNLDVLNQVVTPFVMVHYIIKF
jgi:hypothetical protein